MKYYLTPRELTEWEAYYSIDPFESTKEDIRSAYLASLLTNLVIRTMGKKGAKLTEVKDFLIEWGSDGKPKGQSPEAMREILLALATQQNKNAPKKRLKRSDK